MTTRNSYSFGLRGDISTGGPGKGISIGNISTHISILPCSIPGFSGLYSGRDSICSGTIWLKKILDRLFFRRMEGCVCILCLPCNPFWVFHSICAVPQGPDVHHDFYKLSVHSMLLPPHQKMSCNIFRWLHDPENNVGCLICFLYTVSRVSVLVSWDRATGCIHTCGGENT